MRRRSFDVFTAMLLCLASTSEFALGQTQRGDYYGPHMMWNGWYGMIFGPLMMIAFIAVTVVVVGLLVRWLGSSTHGMGQQTPASREPLDILKERFARGEIDTEEFEERRRLLSE